MVNSIETITHHPAIMLDEKTITTLRQHSLSGERLGHLHPEQLAIVHNEKWFKMFVPERHGGLAWSLPEILKMEECLSWIDGSLGWVVTLCSGAGWFIGFLNETLADDIFSNNVLCVAGSGALSGTAEMTDNGYEINGTWKYASGALHATAFTMNCYITKNNQQCFAPDGSPMTASFIVPSNNVKLHKTWNTMGMISTGSHAFELTKVLASEKQRFEIHADRAVRSEPVYQYPFLQLAETTLAVNLSGMALRFIDLAEIIFSEQLTKPVVQRGDRIKMISDLRIVLDRSRQHFFSTVEASWNELQPGNDLSVKMLEAITVVSYRIANDARMVINTLYPHCGLIAADTTEEINRVWRNFNTAGQHTLFRRGM